MTGGNAVERADAGGEKTLATLLRSHAFASEIARAVPRHVGADRMARIVLTAVRQTPDLARCDQTSFMASVMQAAQLGLEPNTPLGYCWLIPRRRSQKRGGGWECTLQIGYQGMRELAMRTGRVVGLKAEAVREGDHFEYERGLEPTLKHRPSESPEREEAPITHVYAVARIKGEEPVFEVLTIAQVEKHRARSASANDGPWKTDYEAMALKTAVRAIWKWLPKSSELHQANDVDVRAEHGRAPLLRNGDDVMAMLGTEESRVDYEAGFDPETGEVLDEGTKGGE